jgi:hypothetical protein
MYVSVNDWKSAVIFAKENFFIIRNRVTAAAVLKLEEVQLVDFAQKNHNMIESA